MVRLINYDGLQVIEYDILADQLFGKQLERYIDEVVDKCGHSMKILFNKLADYLSIRKNHPSIEKQKIDVDIIISKRDIMVCVKSPYSYMTKRSLEKGLVKGNCIDRFNDGKIWTKIKHLESLSDSISARLEQRVNNNEYHGSVCYEYDFGDLRKISKIAKDISMLCDEMLATQEEKYTKH